MYLPNTYNQSFVSAIYSKAVTLKCFDTWSWDFARHALENVVYKYVFMKLEKCTLMFGFHRPVHLYNTWPLDLKYWKCKYPACSQL